MRKAIFSLILILSTVAIVAAALASSSDKPAYARIVKVERGDFHQVIAITGRLTYRDEQFIYAENTGSISRLLVSPGQRLSPGEPIARFSDIPSIDLLAEPIAQASSNDIQPLYDLVNQADTPFAAMRVNKECTVREVFIEEGDLVTTGIPIARVTSNQQEIRCTVSSFDADGLSDGMWAWISSDEGESMGFAYIDSVGDATVDIATGLSTVDICLIPQAHVNLPEYAIVNAEVYVSGSDDVLCLPIEAITERGTVWWVCDGRCTEIPAEIVMNNEMQAWVNLPEGIQVAIGEFEERQRVIEAPEAAE